MNRNHSLKATAWERVVEIRPSSLGAGTTRLRARVGSNLLLARESQSMDTQEQPGKKGAVWMGLNKVTDKWMELQV